MERVGFGIAVGCAVVSCAIAAILVGQRARSRRRWGRAVEVLREFEEGCSTSTGRLRQVVDAMAVEMNAGLASEGGSRLKMLLTFVDNLPDGYPSSSAEKGRRENPKRREHSSRHRWGQDRTVAKLKRWKHKDSWAMIMQDLMNRWGQLKLP